MQGAHGAAARSWDTHCCETGTLSPPSDHCEASQLTPARPPPAPFPYPCRWRQCEVRAEEYTFVLMSRFINALEERVRGLHFLPVFQFLLSIFSIV